MIVFVPKVDFFDNKNIILLNAALSRYTSFRGGLTTYRYLCGRYELERWEAKGSVFRIGPSVLTDWEE